MYLGVSPRLGLRIKASLFLSPPAPLGQDLLTYISPSVVVIVMGNKSVFYPFY